MVIFGHIQQLLKIQPISTKGSRNLWRLHDEIQANVRSLEHLVVDGATYGVVLTPLVLHQLHAHIRLDQHLATDDLSSVRSTNDVGQENHKQTTKLPKLEIPRYSGDYTEWQPFWDKFTAVIDESNLPVTLLRFRRWKYGLTADITKAFLRIELDERDQETQRFLWDVNDQIKVMRFERVINLNATLKFHLSKLEKGDPE
ncbi:hypothetical protein EGW08_008709 [Elysia chlorotica]|uniref:Uncharacterized protein n=1 Tax=Elysia chlorotica TaxID=188477 RepID=A0A433TPS8_ELYCH|nr:hypothetical protein EGW08_008709 [Elysia chlorotica]